MRRVGSATVKLAGPSLAAALVDALAQNRAHQRQRPIHRCITAAPREFLFRNLIGRGAGDGGEVFTAEERFESAQRVEKQQDRLPLIH